MGFHLGPRTEKKNKSLANLDQFRPIWTNSKQVGQVWIHIGMNFLEVREISEKFEQLKASVDNYSQVWTIIDNFEQS